jgi:hypothetical protein
MRLLTGIYGMNMLVQGMVDVLIVIAALELLHLGSGGPGWLSAAWAVGGLLGGAVAVTLIGRRRLGSGLIVGLLLGRRAPDRAGYIAGHSERSRGARRARRRVRADGGGNTHARSATGC